MTKSLEVLVADMKAAAGKATPGQWVYLPKNTSIEYDVGSDESQGSICYMDSGDFTQRITELNGLHVAAANPENVLKLIAALEQAQQQNKELIDERTASLNELSRIIKQETKAKRAAELRIEELGSNKELIGFRCKRSDGLGEWHYAYHQEPDDFDLKHQIIERIYAVPRAAPALCVKPGDAMREVAPLCVKLPELFEDDRHAVTEAIREAGGAVAGSD